MTPFKSSLMRGGRACADALFPRICYGCGGFMEPGRKPHGATDLQTLAAGPMEAAVGPILSPYVCRQCLFDVTPVDSPVCTRCGEIIKSPAVADPLCSDCISRQKHFTRARAAVKYDGVVLNLIHSFKYRGKTGLAKPLGRLLYIALCRHFDPNGHRRVIPVPLHPKRLRSRGYNQALLMARQWPFQGNTGNGQHRGPRIDNTILLRRKNTDSQTGLGKKQRRQNIGNAFAVSGGAQIHGEPVLLVDDVYTTGSTLEECARVLAKAGAARVDVLTLARAE